jgi:Zn-dependent protease
MGGFHMPQPPALIAGLLVIFFAIGLHEYAHCKFADLAGDPTPRFYGRVTLNLFKHFDPFGTIMILLTMFTGYGIGWGKPAPINPSKMRNPRWDTMIAVAAGPISNILQAVIYAVLFRVLVKNGLLMIGPNGMPQETDFLTSLAFLGILTNLGLAFFNLIPFGILDGHWILGLLLPEKQRLYWFRFNRSYGWQILVGLILVGQFTNGKFDVIGWMIDRPILFSFQLLVGTGLSSG